MQDWTAEYPDFLASPQALTPHIRAEFEGYSTDKKGDKFERFVTRLISESELGLGFLPPKRVTEKTSANDDGVDLISQSRDGRSALYIQAEVLQICAGVTSDV